MPVPAELTVRPITESQDVFRIVATGDPTDERLVESFKSNFGLGKPPRPNSPEAAYRIIWTAISMFEELSQAKAVARIYPRLGRWVAQVRLEPDRGFSVASWGSRGHLSVWGESTSFVDAVVDIVEVDDID